MVSKLFYFCQKTENPPLTAVLGFRIFLYDNNSYFGPVDISNSKATKITQFVFTLLSNSKTRCNFFSKICGLLKISELYIQVFLHLVLYSLRDFKILNIRLLCALHTLHTYLCGLHFLWQSTPLCREAQAHHKMG